ncbi:hypothetical protein AVEN_106159-1 [Araneus ventricosus]|uniref:Uncharacterized protein n=1 Tax=Araneus ventricosus TaxID=182803 RepID=A0A4Y2TB36_ARAVE|nr:hypothetical protein AVEN_106159-1 [Araneus ventricosus]
MNLSYSAFNSTQMSLSSPTTLLTKLQLTDSWTRTCLMELPLHQRYYLHCVRHGFSVECRELLQSEPKMQSSWQRGSGEVNRLSQTVLRRTGTINISLEDEKSRSLEYKYLVGGSIVKLILICGRSDVMKR